MKRLFPVSLSFVLVFFAFSFGQSPKLKPQAADDTDSSVSKSVPSQREVKSDYPSLPLALYDGEIENAGGRISKLSELKGKVVVVNLWGIWCGPCREEMPHLQSLVDKYHSKGLEVLGLSVGDVNGNPESFSDIQIFATRAKISYPLSRISGSYINEIYRISKQQVVPQTILIDRDGRLRGLFIGGGYRIHTEIQRSVEKVLAE